MSDFRTTRGVVGLGEDDEEVLLAVFMEVKNHEGLYTYRLFI